MAMFEPVRARFTAHFVESTAEIFVTCGHFALYVAMAVLAVVALAPLIHPEVRRRILRPRGEADTAADQ